MVTNITPIYADILSCNVWKRITESFFLIEDSIMNSERLTELEIKLAFQEELVETLNQIVAGQQRELDLLQGQVRLVYQQLKSLQPSDIAAVGEEAPPPHY